MIEIISELNPDWWTGRFKGREGLLPSNHVQKLTKATPLTSPPPPPPPPDAVPSSLETKSNGPQPPAYQPPTYAGGFISPPLPPQQSPPYLFRNASFAGSPTSPVWYQGGAQFVAPLSIAHNPNAGPPTHRPDQPAFLRPGYG